MGGSSGGVTSDILVPPAAPGEVINRVTVKVNITHERTSDLALFLRSPSGQTVRLMLADDSTDTLVATGAPPNDTLANLTDTVFADDDPNTTADDNNTTIAGDDVFGPPYTHTYLPVDPLGIYFGSRIDGTWTLTVIDSKAGSQGTLDQWDLTIEKTAPVQTIVRGNFFDQDNDGKQAEPVEDLFSVPTAVDNHPFVLPYAPEAKPITVTGPRVVGSRPVTQDQTDDNLVLNSTTASLDVAFDRTINATTFTPADVLRFIGPSGDLPVGAVTVTPVTALNGAALAANTNSRFFRIGFASQKLPGTYQIQLSADIADTNGTKMDPDTNAGVNVLVGSSSDTATTDIAYGGVFGSAPGVPNANVAVAGNSIATITLNVGGAGYLVNKALANVSVSVPSGGNLRDLEARLVSPDGSRSVLLFNNAPTTGVNTVATNVTFTDQSITDTGASVSPVQNGFATNGFNNPITPLAQVNGTRATGAWKLVIHNKGTATATVSKFALTLTKPVLGSGVGDAIADQTSVAFRVFQADGAVDTAKGNLNTSGPDGNTPTPFETTTNGRVSQLQSDPADPSGNTVYAAGASGGLWRTANFLTRDSVGPTWVPLTDFGPNEVVRDPITGAITRYGAAINIGTFSLFNETGDPQNTKIMIGTGSSALNVIDGGEDNNRYDGVGFLYSEDAGKTWNVLDSKVNYGTPTGGTGLKYLPVADAQRDHMFVGTVINKIVYEKKIVANGNLPIIYAAVGQGSTPAAENMAGLWRSVDGGRSWQQIKDVARGNDLLGKEVTDFAIGEGSALGNTFNRPTIGYVAVQGVGIYQTGNLSAASVNSITFDLMAGGAGRPTVNTGSLTVPAPFTPNGAKGRIQLVTPRYLFGDALANNYYKQWLVAAVSAPGGKLDGVFVTKDQGQNWTRLNLNANGGFADTGADIELTRPLSEDDYFSDRGTAHSIALAMDPTDPNILYVGADRLIRVDMTLINDPFKLQEYSHRDATGGVYTTTTNANNDPSNAGGGLIGPDALDTSRGAPALNSVTPINDAYDADLRATRRRVWNFTNLKFNPYEPFLSNTTIFTSNITTFENNGNDVLWVDPAVRRINASATNTTPEFSNDFDWVSSIITTVDPLTGRARVLWGHDEGVGTFVATEDGSLDRVDGFDQRDVNLTLGPTVATDTARETNLQIEGSRNGNMTVARLYSGDAQPSLLAASVSQSLLLGAARRAGDTYQSGESILADGETSWGDDGRGGRANWVQADQTGTGDVYILRRINDLFRNGDPTTDFFQVQKQGGVPISRTNGLYTGDGTPGSVTRDAQGLGQWTNFVRRFNVNPIDPNGLLMGSNNGRLYGTLDQGKNWFIAADKATAIPGSVTDLDGTYVKAPAFGAPVLTIPGDPPAGLSEYLYAGTEGGNIFVRTGNDLAPVWKKITTALDLSTLDGGPILKLQPSPTRGSNALYAVTEAHVYYMADWTSADPLVNSWKDVTGNLFTLTHKAFTGAYGLNGDFETTLVRRLSSIVVDWRPFTAPTPGLPVLYAAGDAGVFRSLDNGTTWTRFTGTATGAAADGGGLPVAKVSDIDLVLGNITPATGRANSAGSPDALVVTTVGRGMWTLALGKPAGISGPKVVPEKVSPLTPVGVPFSSATVEFDGYINAASFTPADVTVTGPNGPVAVTGVTDITVPDPVTQINLHNRYRIDFVPQNTDGTYTITVGPNITDAGGTKMNQDGDGINGEPVTPTSIGDAFRFNVVVGSTDISDFIHDSYTELLGRSETSAEVILKAPALEKARLTALGVVVKELLIGYDPVTKAYPVGADTARRQLLYRLYNKGGPSTTEVGGFLPTGPTSPASANDPLIDALIADLRANRKTPETITIDILSETNYYTKAGTTTDPVIDPNPATAPSAVFLNNLYKDLFPNLTIDPYTDLTAVTYGNQKTQAGTSTGRKALVTALVNGGPNTVVYDDDGVGVGSTAVKRTDYRTNFVNLAYQQVLGRLPDASVTAAGKADRAFAAAVRAAIAGRAVNGTSGTENVYARLLATKEFFTLQRQAEPLGSDETADAGSHTDRSWVEGVIKKRYFGTPVTFTNSTPPPATISLYSTDLQRDTFSGKILNNATFLTARLNFVRALTLSAEYRTIQVQKYYNQVLGRAAAEAEVKAKVNYASIPSLIAGLLGSADYAIKSGSVVSPALAAVPASRKWAAAVYQTLFGVAPTTASRDYLAAYARAYGRAAAAGRVLSAVDGTTLATASKFTPAGGLHQTYREKILIPQTFTNVLGRLPTPAEVTKYLAFLKLNRWEYFTADLTLGREFYEVVG